MYEMQAILAGQTSTSCYKMLTYYSIILLYSELCTLYSPPDIISNQIRTVKWAEQPVLLQRAVHTEFCLEND
jgi:hypothetical protein